jgi:hypothetical protein
MNSGFLFFVLPLNENFPFSAKNLSKMFQPNTIRKIKAVPELGESQEIVVKITNSVFFVFCFKAIHLKINQQFRIRREKTGTVSKGTTPPTFCER